MTMKMNIIGYLNKVSETNFNRIFGKLIENMRHKSEDEFKTLLKYITDTMFENAIDQKSFCSIYAKVCNNLKRRYKNEIVNIMITDNLIEKIDNKYNESCTKDFSNIDSASIQCKSFCDYTKSKAHMVGIFQFMGELYRDKVINDIFIDKYLNKLIGDITSKKERDTNGKKIVEMQCECLCKFVETLSKRKIYEQVFRDIKILSKNKLFPPRTRFMFIDLLDVMKTRPTSNRFMKR